MNSDCPDKCYWWWYGLISNPGQSPHIPLQILHHCKGACILFNQVNMYIYHYIHYLLFAVFLGCHAAVTAMLLHM